MLIKGCSLADLCLDFTFPGQNDILLVEAGNTKQVDIKNLESYVELCFKFFFVETLRVQITCFREGLEQVKFIFFNEFINKMNKGVTYVLFFTDFK